MSTTNNAFERSAPSANTIEVVGEWMGERFRWKSDIPDIPDTVLGSIRIDQKFFDGWCEYQQKKSRGAADQWNSRPGEAPTIVARGPSEVDELQVRGTYRFFGTWKNHAKYGMQFQWVTFVRAVPHTQTGIIRYLKQAPGIGDTTAEKLWNQYGPEAVRMLRESPDIVSQHLRLPEKQTREASKWLKQRQALEDCSIYLLDLLDRRGFPKVTARAAPGLWGNKAAELLRRNPYLIMKFRGCGFARADAMYLDLGGDPNRMRRQAYSAWYAVASDRDGHTWLPVEKAEAGVRSRISGTEVKVEAAVILAVKRNILSAKRDKDGALWVADQRKAAAEHKLAKLIVQHLEG